MLKTLVAPAPEAHTGDKTTAGDRMVDTEKQINSSMNHLMVAALTLADPMIELRHRAVVVAMAPWLRWHEYQAHFLRSVDNSFQWLMEQQRGAFLATCVESVASLHSRDKVASIGFK